MIKVLLVDDNAIIRKANKQVLPEKGIISVVGECSDGRDVLAFLDNNKVDVILMDVEMKYIGGIEATVLVRKKHPKIIIIGFSGYTEANFRGDMFEAGASDYIVKGVETKMIRERIKSLILVMNKR